MSNLNIRDLDHALPLDRAAMRTIRGGWSLPYLYQRFQAPGDLQSLNPQPLPPKESQHFLAPGQAQSLNPQPLPPRESSLLTHGIIIIGG
jgi:hypothetical protein